MSETVFDDFHARYFIIIQTFPLARTIVRPVPYPSLPVTEAGNASLLLTRLNAIYTIRVYLSSKNAYLLNIYK